MFMNNYEVKHGCDEHDCYPDVELTPLLMERLLKQPSDFDGLIEIDTGNCCLLF